MTLNPRKSSKYLNNLSIIYSAFRKKSMDRGESIEIHDAIYILSMEHQLQGTVEELVEAVNAISALSLLNSNKTQYIIVNPLLTIDQKFKNPAKHSQYTKENQAKEEAESIEMAAKFSRSKPRFRGKKRQEQVEKVEKYTLKLKPKLRPY